MVNPNFADSAGASNSARTRSALAALCACSGLLLACAAVTAPGGGEAPSAAFTLQSPGRADNALLTARFGGNNKANPNCAGENVSPALAWARPPAGTRSFVILMDDQAGRAGLGVSHWVAYGIAASVSGLAEGEASVASKAIVGGRNTIGTDTYFGPCPPRGNAPQHYVFTLIATTLEPDALRAGLSKLELLDALKGKTLSAASLVLRYAH